MKPIYYRLNALYTFQMGILQVILRDRDRYLLPYSFFQTLDHNMD